MKKIFIYTVWAVSVAACSNNAKTEEQEKKERDSIDAAQKAVDQHYVDSIMQADMAKDTAQDSTANQ